MKHILIKNIIFLIMLMSCSFVQAQQKQTVIPVSGGDAQGNGGSISYTIGQVVYTTDSSDQYTVAQGIQQAYEIYIVTEIQETQDILLSAVIYPNPTTDILKLKVQNYPIEQLSYQLYDIDGRQILNQKLFTEESDIDVTTLVHGTYLLKLMNETKEVKVFKVLKH